MKSFNNKKGPFNRTVILVSLFLLLLLCYFNLNYLKEKIRSFSLDKESSWQIERNSKQSSGSYYSREEEVEITSPVFNIDKIYQSMTGPSSIFYFKPDNTQKSEIIWLTDYSVKVFDKKREKQLSEDFICHNNLDIAFSELIRKRSEAFNNRLVMLTQGQTELHFPEGFGLPLFSHDNISINTQALNYNIQRPAVSIRHKINMQFVRNQNIKKRLRPLFKRTANIFVKTCTGNERDTLGRDSTAYCRASVHNNASDLKIKGKSYTGQWIIPVGRDTVKYEITSMLKLPYTTTLHYASVHVHPYCISLALKDVTTGTVLFTAAVKNFTDKTGTEHIDFYSSPKGIEMNSAHRYELICVTNNETPEVHDMMAGMILYFYDKELEKNLENEIPIKK